MRNKVRDGRNGRRISINESTEQRVSSLDDPVTENSDGRVNFNPVQGEFRARARVSYRHGAFRSGYSGAFTAGRTFLACIRARARRLDELDATRNVAVSCVIFFVVRALLSALSSDAIFVFATFTDCPILGEL